MRASAAFALTVAGLCSVNLASPWVATNYEIVATSTVYPASTWSDGYVADAYIINETLDAVPTVTPMPEGLSARTTQDSYNSDLTEVYVVLPESVGRTATYYTSRDDSYYILLTYTASTTCATPWTWTTSAPLYPPQGVVPSATATSAVTTSLGTYIAATTAYNKFINPADVPPATISSLASVYEPLFSGSCTIPSYYTQTYTSAYPSSTYTSGPSSPENFTCSPFSYTFGGSSIGGGYFCADGYHYTHGLTLTAFICIWIFSFFGLFLLAGLAQSYYSFRSLCLGESARRGLPFLWAMMFPLLSCLLLIATRSGFAAKDPGEQAVLRERWDSIGAGAKVKQWLKWGFRFKYPPFLGAVPLKRGRSGYTRNAGMYQYQPPGVQGHGAPYGSQGGYQAFNPQMQQWQQPGQWNGWVPSGGAPLGVYPHGIPAPVPSSGPGLGLPGEGQNLAAAQGETGAVGSQSGNAVSPVTHTTTQEGAEGSEGGLAGGGGVVGGSRDRATDKKGGVGMQKPEAGRRG
ncbi:MAG: hypothetical protein MMC23_008323 [Stictis urceolatum]|nr:hypothetical protein [Stictis urceolata]